jgi:hypothetical protein
MAEHRKNSGYNFVGLSTKNRPDCLAEYMDLRVQAPPGPLRNLTWDRPSVANLFWTLKESLCSTLVGLFERRPNYGQQDVVFEHHQPSASGERPQ